MNLLEILSVDTIRVPLTSSDKQGAINELVELLGEQRRITDVNELKQVVWEREQQRTTGIGEGLAIPHGKSRSADQLAIAVGKPETPMEFDAIDNKPVQLIVLLASPPDRTADHIQALGRISRMMADPATRRRAYAAESAEALFEMFQQACG